ncbi:50S ribosomal protein L28 [Candidatus Hepatincolaceae symbiont of Richtersius coronifer]
MTRSCSIAKKRPLSGNNVSHANNKTKRKYLPNIQVASFYSNILEKSFRFKLSASAIKTIDSKGGLDAWILQAKSSNINGIYKKIHKLVITKIQEAK